MNLTRHSTQLRGAARLIPVALSFALIGAACTSALAFRLHVALPKATPHACAEPTVHQHIRQRRFHNGSPRSPRRQ